MCLIGDYPTTWRLQDLPDRSASQQEVKTSQRAFQRANNSDHSQHTLTVIEASAELVMSPNAVAAFQGLGFEDHAVAELGFRSVGQQVRGAIEVS